MTGHEARELFSAVVDGTATAEERARCDAHLAGCADCRRELERFRATVALLRAVEPARAPAGFAERVIAAARPAPWYRRVLEHVFLPLPLKLPMEAAAVVMVGVLVGYLFRHTPEFQQAAREEAPRPAVTGGGPPAPPAPAPARTAEQAVTVAQQRAAGARKDEGGTPQSVGREPRSAIATPPAGRMADALEANRETAPAEPLARAAPPAEADVVGTLAVEDREDASHKLDELVARLGGVEASRRVDPDATVVQILLPRAAYAEFARGLGLIGSWLPDRAPAELPGQVRLGLRITD